MKFNINNAIEYMHMPIMHINENKTAFVLYNQFDMGAKYKVYSIRKEYRAPNFETAFDNLFSASKYADKIF